MIAMMMLMLLLMRSIELQVLVNIGIYKNVELMSDKEMFSEYEKLKKQSNKLQKRLRKAKKKKGGAGRTTKGNMERISVAS